MPQIIVITHGNLANELVDILEQILKKESQVIPVCFDLNWDPSFFSEKIEEVLNGIGSNRNIIILTDLFGGTPSNLSIPYIKKNMVEVITGVNLPMLVYLLSQPKGKDFKELCLGAKKAGADAIVIAGEFLS